MILNLQSEMDVALDVIPKLRLKNEDSVVAQRAH